MSENLCIFVVGYMEYKLIHIEETDSTNRWLKAHGEGTMVVVADYQTAGKGCGTNSWESERGKNLTFSMLIHPTDIPASQQFRITEVVSVALCEVLEQYIGDVSIKWPNDIYMGDKKICGVLIENRLQGNVIVDSIIGIGLNVNQTEFVSDAPNPVSLRQLLGREIDREALLHDFLETLETVSSSETTYSAYRNKLFRMGKQAVFSDETGRFEGTIQDVETDGRLLIKDLSGQARRYAFKEVQFVI
jgi:BirA family biotin operon repressor/biotin-[acetyl-CoA-carboxylase] ligase